MPVYVDNMRASYGRLVMSHMVADTHRELMDMAAAIGLDARWLQETGTAEEHFDVCQQKRALAVDHGAEEITTRDCVRMIRTRRLQGVGGEDEYYERMSARL